ncbi:unnamed protein product [Discosporangium mesarthrocarpum]
MYLSQQDMPRPDARLVFYLKGQESSPGPRRVIIPLNVWRTETMFTVQKLLESCGCSVPSLPTRPTPQSAVKANDVFTIEDHQGAPVGQFDNIFRDPATTWSWDWRPEAGRWEDRTEVGRGGRGRTGSLGHILETKEGRELVREMKASGTEVERVVGTLQEKYGFGKFEFRCGWSQSNLLRTLTSLLTTCETHQGAFRVVRFGGLSVVFLLGTLEGSTDYMEGEIRLSPSDVPLVWVSTLSGVTQPLLEQAEGWARELERLEERASAILRGARLSRGLSCSGASYCQFLQEICREGRPLSANHSQGTVGEACGLVQGDWSGLTCKVEGQQGRASTVLEDGVIQVCGGPTNTAVCLQLHCSTAVVNCTR